MYTEPIRNSIYAILLLLTLICNTVQFLDEAVSILVSLAKIATLKVLHLTNCSVTVKSIKVTLIFKNYTNTIPAAPS